MRSRSAAAKAAARQTAGREETVERFAGKNVSVTGDSSGIGRTIALVYACEKAHVLAADPDLAPFVGPLPMMVGEPPLA